MGLLVISLTAAVLHAAVLLPVFGARPGQYPLLDNATDFVGAFCASLMLWIRARRERPETRPMWRALSLAVLTYILGSLASIAARFGLLGPLGPEVGFVGWGAFYLFGYAAIVHLLRQRVRRFHPSLWLDGLVAGLAVAAFTVAFLLAPVSRALGGRTLVVLQTLVLPVGDILLLALLAGVLAVIWRKVGPDVWAMALGMVAFVTTDLVFALQLSRGEYVDGGAVDLGWVLAQLCLAVAACLPSRRTAGARMGGTGVMIVPGLASVAAILLLLHATWDPVPAAASRLALAAVAVALARTLLTFNEIRALADSRREARTDDLTGLPNLRRFLEELAGLPGPAERAEDAAVLMFDVDRFKEINDLHGHGAGDEVIRTMGDRLAADLRDLDMVARLDGDAFAVLARRVDAQEAVGLAHRLRARLEEPLVLGSSPPRAVSSSVGVAVTSPHVRTGTELLQLADLAMYAAKARRAGVLLYDHARDGQGRHRAGTIEQLRHGIGRDELRLHFQPKLDLRSGRVVGTEALVRWQHPARGLLYPDAFVELAESSGLMPRLTRTVLDLALAQLRSWRDAGLELSVAVNVSTSDLTDESFPALVELLLERHGVPPAALVVEVTENLLMADREGAIGVLARLSGAGVTVAIDDYGTGYSSLAYLADLPVGELKLDRAFVGTMLGDPRSRTIVTSTIDLAHALGLRLTAEGVEDGDTLAALVQEGCDVAQGYHIGRPVPPDQLTGLLTATAPGATRAAGGGGPPA